MGRRQYQTPPLHLYESKAGAAWVFRYRERVIGTKDGRPQLVTKPRWKMLGLKKSMTEKQAERARDEIMRLVNAPQQTQSSVLFEDFLKIYQEQHYRGMKATSQDYYSARIDKWILPVLRGRKLGAIGSLDITMLLATMEQAHVARKTRSCTKGIISSIFRQARRWGYLNKDSVNPTEDAEVGRDPGATRDMWTPTMAEAQAIMECSDEELALILETLIWTGMRISELCGLRCLNVDIEQGIAYIRERNVRGSMDTPKGQTNRSTGNRALPLGYLTGKLAPLMVGQPPEAFLFHQPGGASHTDKSLTERMRSAMKESGHVHLGNLFHAFRRLHANLMKKGMSDFDLQKQMGHSDIHTTRLYVSDDLQGRKDALKEAQANVVPIRRQA